MKYFDTHAHINIEPLSQEADKIIEECKKEGIILNNVGTDVKESLLAVEQAKKYKSVFATVGIHPTCVNKSQFASNMKEIEKLLKQKKENKIIAIGETGLDYYHKPYDKETQKEFFLKHIELAKKYNLPLVLHVRDAHEDAYEILKNNLPKVNIVIHCFDSTMEMAKKYVNLGCYLGIGGLITNSKKKELHKTIKEVDTNRLLSETDCPFLTPEKFKPQKNRPIFMLESIKIMSEIMNLEKDKLEKKLFENAMIFFNPKQEN